MSFIKSSFLLAVSNAVGLITRVVVNKVVAINVGAEGFAIYGQFKDFVSIVSSTSQLGADNGIIKYSAETKNKSNQQRRFLATAFKIHLYSSIVTFLIVFFFKDSISNLLFQSSDYSLHIVAICFSIVFVSLYNLILGVLNGLELLKKYIWISIVTAILTSTNTIFFVTFNQLNGLIFSIAINHVVVFLVAFLFIFQNREFTFNFFKIKFDIEYLKKLLSFSVMNITGIVTLSVSLIFIRTHLTNRLGLDYAGFWDSVWRISSIYIVFLTSSFKFYLLPTFSKMEVADSKKEILGIWKVTFPSILLIVIVIYLLKDFIILFLFTPEFLIIKSIIVFQLLGDVIRIHSWTLGNILLAKKRTKVFVLFQVVWAVTFCTLGVTLSNYYNLRGITMAYFFTYILHFVLLNLYLKKELWQF